MLQRFYNETASTLSDVEFDLIELDINGKVIQRRSFDYHGLTVRPGEWFSIPQGIVVSSDCVDFKFARLSAVSGRFVYRVKRGNIQTYYDRRRGARSKAMSYFESVDRKISSCTPRFRGIHGIAAAIALLLTVLVCIYLLLL